MRTFDAAKTPLSEAQHVLASIPGDDITKIATILHRDGLLGEEGTIMACGPASHMF